MEANMTSNSSKMMPVNSLNICVFWQMLAIKV